MPLDPADGQKVIEWLRSKGSSHRPCPVCGETGWDVGAVVRLSAVHRDPDGTRRRLPVVPVSCRNCAHTLLFLAKPSGVQFPLGRPRRAGGQAVLVHELPGSLLDPAGHGAGLTVPDTPPETCGNVQAKRDFVRPC
jgi:hypothetical protein